MNGLFNNLYVLKGSISLNPLEDYLTEIFAFCLQNNTFLWEAFSKRFVFDSREELIELSTQISYFALDGHGAGSKPDITAFTKNKAIFIENKVASYEGNDQLKRYADHLGALNYPEKYLLYITRDYDPKSAKAICLNCKDVKFLQLRWYQFSNLLKNFQDDPLVKELLSFMFQNKLTMSNQFTPTDIITLANFEKVMKMMQEAIGGAVEVAFRKFVGASKKKTFNNMHFSSHGRIILQEEMKDGMWVGLGFWLRNSNEDDYPLVKLQIEISPNSSNYKNSKKIFSSIPAKYQKWASYNLDNPHRWAGVNCTLSLHQIMSSKDHINELQNFFLEGIEEMERMRIDHPNLPWK